MIPQVEEPQLLEHGSNSQRTNITSWQKYSAAIVIGPGQASVQVRSAISPHGIVKRHVTSRIVPQREYFKITRQGADRGAVEPVDL